MNWEMIGAIGEIAGAAAVVLTLGYLALQVRESARQDRRHQSAELQRDRALLTDALTRDPLLPGIFLRGLRDLASLDEEETVRFSTWLLNAVRLQETIFYFQREDGIHDFQAGSIEASLKEIMFSPGAQAWWVTRRHWFSPEYQTEIDRWISTGSSGLLRYYDSQETGES